MGMGNSFETITVLQYRLKEAQEELAAFQSGEKLQITLKRNASSATAERLFHF